MKLAILALMILSSTLTFASTKIEGVWDLTSFETKDVQGKVKPWCKGAYGTIVYYQKYMSVAINCSSDPKRMLFYSGPYQIEGDSVVHNVKNYSDISLKQVFRRKIEMPDKDHLNLVGLMGNGDTVILAWKRREKLTQTTKKDLAGVYKLVLSQNEFEGETGVPYCTGVFGTILFTLGGYVAVSLNCLPKKDELKPEPADVHGRKYFYAGTYTIENGQAINLPENGSMVEHIGHPQVREMSLSRGRLVLSGTNGSDFVAVWKK